MAQSFERWGGNCEALVLLNASIRSWYSTGSRCVERGAVTSPPIWRVRSRQCWRQPSDQWVICLSGQEIVRLCFSSQGSPRMIGVCGDWKTNSRIVSVWKAPVHSDRSSVVNWIRPEPSGRPSSAATAKRDSQATRGIRWVLEKAESMKFPAAPESIKAVVSITSPLTLNGAKYFQDGGYSGNLTHRWRVTRWPSGTRGSQVSRKTTVQT